MVVAGPLAWDSPLPDRAHPGRGWALVIALVAIVAVVAAFVQLPYDDIAQGAQIVSTDPAFAGAAALQRDDVVTAVDAKPTASAEDLVTVIRSHRPGDRMRLRVMRAGAPRDVDVTIGGEPGRPMLGVR